MGKKKIFIAAVMCLLVISVSVQGSNDIRKAKESDKNSDNGIVEKNITINYEKEFCNGIDGIDEPYKSNGITLFTISGTWIQENNGKWWYRHDDGTYTCNGWEEINSKWYYFDAEGWMVTGWIEVDGHWYYTDQWGAMCTGWIEVDGHWYYMDQWGAMCTGWIEVDGHWYYMVQWGAMCTGWVKVDGYWYYMDQWGEMYTGWLYMKGERYYLNENGVMITGKYNMWDQETKKFKDYYFSSDGRWEYTVSLITWDLVDSGKHLDWSGKTKYSSYITTATKKWNAYKKGIIRKDTVSTMKDVTISDYYDDKDTLWGETSKNGTIRFNIYNMDKDDDAGRLNTVMHEFGHALGLGHNERKDVMSKFSNVTELTENDKKSYDAAYRKY